MTKIDELLFQALNGNFPDIGGANLPISADDVSDSTSRVMVSPSQRGQIDVNTNDINSHSQRITDLENEFLDASLTDEKVKLNASDVAGYLSDKLDGTTLQTVGDKLVVTGVEGLTATIAELNLLQGSTANIQAQINALSNVGNFTTSVGTYADLMNLTPNANDLVIVLTDENNLDTTSIYIYNGTDWVYSGEFRGGEVRDFTTNPLNLVTETTNILPKDKYELQNASDTSLETGGVLASSNVRDGMIELFQFADSGKRKVANAIGSPVLATDDFDTIVSKYQALITDIANVITEKGIPTYSYNKLNELPVKIASIPNINVDVGLKKLNLLNVDAPQTVNIALNETYRPEDVNTTIYKITGGAGNVLHYDVGFDASDASGFQNNEDVVFDGVMKLKTEWELDMVKDDTWADNGELRRVSFSSNDWYDIDKLNIEKL